MNTEKIRAFYMAELTALRSRPCAQPASGARNLVIGLAADLHKCDIDVFVNSLRHSGYTDEIVLFVTHVDAEMETYCRRKSVTLAKALNTVYSPLSLMLMRFSLYYDYITSRQAAGVVYDSVLLTDVTDVVFQKDPFKVFSPDRLAVFCEGDVTIGECPVNGGWLKIAFGEEEFERLQGERVFCAGTTMGPARDIQEYLLMMMLGGTNAKPAALTQHGCDQAIHNYLIYNHWLPRCLHSENGDVVLTLHYHLHRGWPLYTDSDGHLCDDSGRIFPVLHQYTRAPSLKARYQEMFAEAA